MANSSFACAALETYDDAVESVFSAGGRGLDSAFPFLGAALLLAGGAVAVAGKALAAPTACLASGGAAALSLGIAIDASAAKVSCLAALVSIGTAFLAGCAVGFKVMRLALFLLGASVGLAVGYTFFLFFPSLASPASLAASPSVFSRPLLPYWAALLLSGTAAGVLVVRKKDAFLLLATAVLGGTVATLGLHLILRACGADLPMQAYGGIGAATSATGAAAQRWREGKGKERGGGEAQRRTTSSTPPA